MMHVQKFIAEKGWEALETELNIVVKKYDCGIAKLNYSQFAGPKTHPVVMECRGLILSYPDAEVVARAFPRFFNLGEAPEITGQCDFHRATFSEKADGSLVMVYFCPQTDRWEISTRGMAFAEGNAPGGGLFVDRILSAMDLDRGGFEIIMDAYPSEDCFVFEYCGPSNRIVTRYPTEHVKLLTIIQRSGCEDAHGLVDTVADRLMHEGMRVHQLNRFDINDRSELSLAMGKLGPFDEGFVAHDPVTNVRVKIKSESYVTFHKLRGNGPITPRLAAELVAGDGLDDYLAAFPEDENAVMPYIEYMSAMVLEMNSCWNYANTNTVTQKDFALRAKGRPYSAILFNAKKNLTLLETEFLALTVEKRAEMLLRYIGL